MKLTFVHNLMTSTSEEQAEFDSPATVAMISHALSRLGHEVELLEASGTLSALIAQLETSPPDLILNTAEGSHGRAREGLCPALFERMGIPYIGSDAYTCVVTLDKQLTKDIVAASGVNVAPSVMVNDPDQLLDCVVPMPAIIKPNFEGSSKGISSRSIVDSRRALIARGRELLARYPDGVIIESYIAGLDVVVPFIEGAAPETGGVLEPASYSYRCRAPASRAPARQIYDGAMKRDGFDGLQIDCPARVSPATRELLIEQARRSFTALGIRDLGRIDFRVDEAGTPYFLEVNALPSLEEGASIYLCGEPWGVSGVERVLAAVIDSAARRYGMVRAAPELAHAP